MQSVVVHVCVFMSHLVASYKTPGIISRERQAAPFPAISSPSSNFSNRATFNTEGGLAVFDILFLRYTLATHTLTKTRIIIARTERVMCMGLSLYYIQSGGEGGESLWSAETEIASFAERQETFQTIQIHRAALEDRA